MKIRKASLVAGIAFVIPVAFGLQAPARYELLLSGPVESVNAAAKTVSLLGHQISVRDVTAVYQGQRVNVFGVLGSDGSLRAAIVQNTNLYSASGDKVLLSGRVNSISGTTGRLSVEGASVDYTALMAGAHFSLPHVGDTVRITGVQPSGRGTILAGELSQAESVIGSTVGAKSVIGSTVGAKSVIGSTVGAKSVIGSTVGAKSVIGSTIGAASVIGSTAASR